MNSAKKQKKKKEKTVADDEVGVSPYYNCYDPVGWKLLTVRDSNGMKMVLYIFLNVYFFYRIFRRVVISSSNQSPKLLVWTRLNGLCCWKWVWLLLSSHPSVEAGCCLWNDELVYPFAECCRALALQPPMSVLDSGGSAAWLYAFAPVFYWG